MRDYYVSSRMHSRTGDTPRLVALATYATRPDLTDDDRLLVPALAELGATSTAAAWSDPDVDWSAFDAVVIRSCWDYHLRPDAFLEWIARLESNGVVVINSPSLLRWNLEKTYLRELGDRGITVLPTRWFARGEAVSLENLRRDTGWGDVVIKPAISASAFDTWLSSADRPTEDESRLRAALDRGGILVQPYLSTVAEHGEWSLLFFDGQYSHAVLKRPQRGDFRVQSEHGGSSHPAEPESGVIAQASEVLRAAPERTCYARVDGCVNDGRFVLMELELIEPHVFLATHPLASERFARAILARL